MKVINVIKKILISILAVAFFAFAIAMTVLLLNINKYGVTQFNGTSLLPINAKISSDKYKKGDLVLVENKTFEEIKVGDELFAYRTDKEGNVSIDLGVVDIIDPSQQAVSFKNGSAYAIEYIAGTGGKVYNNIGTYLSIIMSKWGFLFIILVPSFLILIYEIYALVVEIKYGKEEATNN
jgi:hypothetical protein